MCGNHGNSVITATLFQNTWVIPNIFQMTKSKSRDSYMSLYARELFARFNGHGSRRHFFVLPTRCMIPGDLTVGSSQVYRITRVSQIMILLM
jgi:hypothetical protein